MPVSTIAVYIAHSLFVRMSEHLINTKFGILSGPGALNGLRRAMCLQICSLVIGSMVHTGTSVSTLSSVLAVC
jgi:hypothetical protein